jgi:hypothetical protein
MRYVIDLYQSDGEVHGEVLAEGRAEPVAFRGWLELVRLLELPPPPTGPAPRGVTDSG